MKEIRRKVRRSLQGNQFAVTLQYLREGLSAGLFDAIALQAGETFRVKHSN